MEPCPVMPGGAFLCLLFLWWLVWPHRWQASSHRGCGVSEISVSAQMWVGWVDPIAGKPAPTGVVVFRRFQFRRKCGLAGLVPSLASQLPQGLWCFGNFSFGTNVGWLGWPHRQQASSHRFCGVSDISVPAQIPVGAGLPAIAVCQAPV